ncbi:DUF6491 family protein [Sphingomonas sp. Leaf343]|uniref:DUF6491 family protein n=1 Tax=Sphingomonas sp. Leaf343 TaxID=1736345 RepID=UPI0006FB13B7|nr:DUF6491 family protein [Sphingomonas sp. Leaf343]KQR87659.1 hypothetical protein ASG07_01845 [Sphingomonas sp. Leaf343]
MLLPILTAALIQTATAGTPPEKETVISYAGNGGLRDWEHGPTRDVLFVRDRTERWYRVTTSGPCPRIGNLDTLTYTTDSNGVFDRFSRIRFLRYPNVTCGVKSIVSTATPPSKGGKLAAKR